MTKIQLVDVNDHAVSRKCFYLAEVGQWWMCRTRKQKIFLSMPDALDLLVVCVEAGLGLDAAIRRVTEEMVDAAPEICNEFAKSNLQLQMGRQRREVLHDLGVRTGVDDMRALAAILIQADRFGSSIAQALRVQSDSMRVKRMQRAEERAQKATLKLILPSTMIFGALLLIFLAPGMYRLMGAFNPQ